MCLVLAQVLTLWYFTEPLLLLCQPPPNVAYLSARYVHRFGIGLFPAMLFEALKRFLQGSSSLLPSLDEWMRS